MAHQSDSGLGWLLKLYPRSHRERYAAEMEECFRAERASSGGGFAFLLRTTIDHSVAAAAVRMRRPDRRPELRGGRARRSAPLAGFAQDLGYAVRSLRRAPAFTAVAIGTLALGIGATTAAFSVVDRVAVRPLPYPGSDRMFVVGWVRTANAKPQLAETAAQVRALIANPGPAESVVGIIAAYSVLDLAGHPEAVQPYEVTEDFFDFFGANPERGRVLLEEDFAAGAAPVVVVSHSFWKSRLAGDPKALGMPILLDSVPTTVVGVLGPDFVPPEQLMIGNDAGDLWVPMSWESRLAETRSYQVRWTARLRPDSSPDEFAEHAARVFDEVDGQTADPRTRPPTIASLASLTIGTIGTVLWRVLAAIALLLVIACVNVAALVLTRGATRARELEVRASIGATRSRIVRQLFSESVLLAAGGAAAGAASSWAAIEAFRRASPEGLPRLVELQVDGRAFGFSALAGLGSLLLVGLIPAIRASGWSTWAARSSSADRRGAGLRRFFVFLETTLAVLLAVGSGLLIHDLIDRIREPQGYRSEGLVAASLYLNAEYYDAARIRSFWDAVRTAAEQIPGAEAYSLAGDLPNRAVTLREISPEGPTEQFRTGFSYTDASFQSTTELQLIDGRWFADGEENVVVVNQSFVSAHWPGLSDVLGRSVAWSTRSHPVVVGVVADAPFRPGVRALPHVYQPFRSDVLPGIAEFIVRGRGDEDATTAALDALIRRIDPALLELRVRPLHTDRWNALAKPRFYTVLLSGLGVCALLLASIGIYGTTSFIASSRKREIGIRMALGARRDLVIGDVVGQTLLTVTIGIAAGLGVAFLVSPALRGALVTVHPEDTTTYLTVAGVVLGAAVLSTWAPAFRAVRIDPARTLREDP